MSVHRCSNRCVINSKRKVVTLCGNSTLLSSTQQYTAQHYNTPHELTQHCSFLLYSTLLHSSLLGSTIFSSILLYTTLLYSTLQHSCNTTPHNTTQYYTIPYLQLVSWSTSNWSEQHDVWQQSIRRCGHWTEFRVILAQTFSAVRLKFHSLAWIALCLDKHNKGNQKSQTIYCWVEWILKKVFFVVIELWLQKHMEQMV